MSAPLERVHAQVVELRDAQAAERLAPDREAAGRFHLAEHGIPIAVPKRHEDAVIVVIGEIGPVAFSRLPSQKRQLVIAVEMDLEGARSNGLALQEAVLDRRVAGGRQQRREPVDARSDLVGTGCAVTVKFKMTLIVFTKFFLTFLLSYDVM
jgi:hypothetical protein